MGTNRKLLGGIFFCAVLFADNLSPAQGQFTFSGAQVYLSTTGLKTSPSSAYDYGFYVGPSPNAIASIPILTVQGIGIANGLIGGTQTIPTQPAGTAEYFVVKGWSASLGVTSYEAALQSQSSPFYASAFAGVSPVGFVTLADVGNLSVPAALFGVNNAPGIQVNIPQKSLVLSPILIPEPRCFLLAGLACAAWGCSRRRN